MILLDFIMDLKTLMKAISYRKTVTKYVTATNFRFSHILGIVMVKIKNKTENH